MTPSLVVSKDLAVRLRDAGFPQNTYFWYLNLKRGWTVLTHEQAKEYDPINPYAAPTAGELGEALPWNYRLPQKKLLAGGEYPDNFKETEIWDMKIHGDLIEARTEADARALMWLHLRERGIL